MMADHNKLVVIWATRHENEVMSSTLSWGRRCVSIFQISVYSIKPFHCLPTKLLKRSQVRKPVLLPWRPATSDLSDFRVLNLHFFFLLFKHSYERISIFFATGQPCSFRVQLTVTALWCLAGSFASVNMNRLGLWSETSKPKTLLRQPNIKQVQQHKT